MNEQNQAIDFSVDTSNLYREEGITDLKVASIRSFTPIHLDGTEDKSRKKIYVGNTQLMSPQGPVPLQAAIDAASLEEAASKFPEAMEKAMAEMIENVKRAQQEQANKQKEDSRIIMPGR